jgi:glycosyltransferase involved in cell wall biosynthesis
MTLLSIIVPVYNTQAYLAHCLGSICDQLAGSNGVEVWIVDDGSPDDSISIIWEYESRFPSHVRVIRKANGGLSDARNAALESAAGEFVWFVDSDDAIAPSCLSEILPILSVTPADYLMFDAVETDAEGRPKGLFENLHPAESLSSIPFTADNMRRHFSRHMVWMRIFRRSLIGELRFPVGVTHEDIHFDLQLLIREPTVQFLRRNWYRHYFDNPESITNTMTATKFREVLWIYQDLEARFCERYANESRYSEYLKLGVTDLLGRAKYMLTVPRVTHERFHLFREYAREIARFLGILAEQGNMPMNVRGADRRLLQLISKRQFTPAYMAARSMNAAKWAYDELGRRTHRLRRGNPATN